MEIYSLLFPHFSLTLFSHWWVLRPLNQFLKWAFKTSQRLWLTLPFLSCHHLCSPSPTSIHGLCDGYRSAHSLLGPPSTPQSSPFLCLCWSFPWRCFPDPEFPSATDEYSALVPIDSTLLQAQMLLFCQAFSEVSASTQKPFICISYNLIQ